MRLAPGMRFGPYEVVAPLGAGGMGEVYRAKDTKLGRDVALKTLTPEFTADPDHVARFSREAHVLASLNHTHIAAIHGLEESEGITALVLELVEGPTLADRIKRGPIPFEESLALATQIVDALDVAHEAGVIHRDLKPANIKIRPDGVVKVLDFGLAKSTLAATAENGDAATITSPAMTRAGLILGTAAYMSPEQAKGRAVDKRADVWAFGAVLFEMLTGQRAFGGEDVSDTFAAVLRAEPNWKLLPSMTPPSIERLLRRALEKDPRARLSDMAMVRVELRDARYELANEGGSSSTDVVRRPARYRLLPFVAGALLAGLVGAALWSGTRQVPPPPPVVRFDFELPDDGVMSGAGRKPLAMSPDGRRLVFAANQRLYVREFDRPSATALPGTERGGQQMHARMPILSADGEWVAFWQDRQLRKLPLTGGASVLIAEWSSAPPPFGGHWQADGEILLGAGSDGIMRVMANGGAAERLIEVKPTESASMPIALPASAWILFILHEQAAEVDQGQLVAHNRQTGERRVLSKGLRDLTLLPPDRLVVGRGNTLLVQQFDPANVTVIGDPVSMVEGVASIVNNPGLQFAISGAGALVYRVAASVDPIAASRLIQLTRDGKPTPLAEVTGLMWFPRYSPDGSRIAYGVSVTSDLNSSSDLWVLDMARGSRTRVTFAANTRFYPIWTRDGNRLTFADGTGQTNQLQWALADGSGGLETLVGVGERKYPTSWSPDGRVLAIYQGGSASVNKTRDLWMLQVEGGKRELKPFVQTQYEERGAIFSPDGRWVAYVSDKTGQNDVFARPYPGPGAEITVSVGGGQEPAWGSQGKELFYRRAGKLMVVPIESKGPTMIVGAPAVVFDDRYRLDTGGAAGGVANYDVSPDGKRFVMIEVPQSGAAVRRPGRVNVVLNWRSEVEQRTNPR